MNPQSHIIRNKALSFGMGLFLSALVFASACSLSATRPVQEMSDAAAALKAAKEVSADTLAPELFRKANEAYFRARNEYQMKNFVVAQEYILRAKRLAEDAEFEALRQGAQRSSVQPPEEPPPPPEPSTLSTPTGTPAFLMPAEGSGTPPSTGNGSGGATGAGTPPYPQQ